MSKETATLEGIHEEALISYENCASNNQEATKELIITLNSYGLSVATGEATIKRAKKDGYIVEGLSFGMFRHVKTASALYESGKADGKTARQVLGLSRRMNEHLGLNDPKVIALITSDKAWDDMAEEVKRPRKAGATASEKEANKATITSLDNLPEVLLGIFNSLTTKEGRTTFISKVDSVLKTVKAYQKELDKAA